MCQKYLPKDCWSYLQKPCTSYGTSLVDCIKAATENPDCECGLFAPDPECYDQFAEIFLPVIADYHKLDISQIGECVHDMGDSSQLPDLELKYTDSIVSTRVSVSRTINGYPMGPKLTRQTREQIKSRVIEALHNFQGDLYGEYIELAEMSNDEREKLISSNYLYPDATNKQLKSANAYKDWPLNRGIYLNRNKTLVVWINEEDHVRIISLQKGAQLKQVYARLVKALAQLEKSLEFVHHKKYGYLTFSPTNIGTSLRVSVMVRLPKMIAAYQSVASSGLSQSNAKLRVLADSLGLSIGEINGADGVVELSSSVVLGKTEFEIVSSTWNSIKRMLDEEALIK